MGYLQVHHGDRVPRVRKELFQHLRRLQLQAAGADAGVTAQVLRLVDLPLYEEPDPVLRSAGLSAVTRKNTRPP